MSSTQQEAQSKLELVYTLFCDDVRLEVGNKLSYMGAFQSIIVPQLPVWLPKLAVVNHWRGNGDPICRLGSARRKGVEKLCG